MSAVKINSLDELTEGKYGIKTAPPGSIEIYPEEIDFAVVPALWYDKSGIRLGRGGGYYDRYLPKLREDAYRAGVCFDVFLTDELPREAHDARVHTVVTDKRMYEVKYTS